MGDLGENMTKWAHGHKLRPNTLRAIQQSFGSPIDKCPKCPRQNLKIGKSTVPWG